MDWAWGHAHGVSMHCCVIGFSSKRTGKPLMRVSRILSATFLLWGSALGAAHAQAKTDWLTFGFDALRSGYNPQESTLGQNNVGSLKPAWVFAAYPFEVKIDPGVTQLNAVMRGQPVVAHNVTVSGTPTDLVIGGDENGFLFALDANSTKAAGKVVWYNELGRRTAPSCNGSTRSVGIQSAATINRTANGGKGVVYVAYNGAVHALDLATGVELKGWPVTIPMLASASTDGFSHDAINDVSDGLYVGTSSICDITPYWGRVVRIDPKTGHVLGSWFALSGNGTPPSVSGGGIWGQGGVAIDTAAHDGGVYLATGNAEAANPQTPYAETVVHLSMDLSRLISAASPTIPPGDNDFGSAPQLFQPTGCAEKLLAVPNKIGLLVVESVGHGGALHLLQSLHMASTTDKFDGAIAWDPADQLLLVTTPEDGQKPYVHGLSAMRVNAKCTGISLAWHVSPSISPDAKTNPFSPATVANGVVYFGVEGPNEDQLFAVAASKGSGVASGQVLWQSPALAGGMIAPPTVVNGRVFVVAAGQMTAFAMPGN
jgi:hypothetical protein